MVYQRMSLPAGINRRHALFGGFILVIVWLWVALDRPVSFESGRIWNPYSNKDTPLVNPTKDIFDFAPLKSWVIQDACETAEWNSDLVFTCDNNHGGVGHVRNSILNCVRFAISAGASLVLPNIALRDDDVWDYGEMSKRHGPGRKGLEYMFDKQHFVHSLRHSCPQLNLIEHLDQYAGGRRHALVPESLVKQHPTTGIENLAQWRENFYSWVDITIPSTPRTERVVIDLEQSFLAYHTHADSHAFAHHFGQILKFRSDVRRLATSTIHALSRWYDLHLEISKPIIPNSYFAAHLRTEDPMIPVEGLGRRHSDIMYSHYDAQTQTYLTHAQNSNVSIIYVASGNISEVHRFALEAADLGVDVTHKEDLLKGKDRDELEGLRWDQRALIDYLVLLKAQEFTGVGHSSFSWNVALKRHELGAEGKKPMIMGDQPNGVWSDGISHIYGVQTGYIDSSKCMWA
jgi:hypothetical protein